LTSPAILLHSSHLLGRHREDGDVAKHSGRTTSTELKTFVALTITNIALERCSKLDTAQRCQPKCNHHHSRRRQHNGTTQGPLSRRKCAYTT
jgi:hypothetical protein